MQHYPIVSHCETAVIFEQAIMLVLQPVVVPFYYSVYVSDSDDFFIKYCVDCSVRTNSCMRAGSINTRCKLGHRVRTDSQIACIQMPIPRHVLLFAINGEAPRFAYEDGEYLSPLRLGNIGENGWWCHGEVNYNIRSPTSMYEAYMKSIHNSDLTGKGGNNTEYEDYLKKVSKDFTKIVDGDSIQPTRYWGDIRNVIDTPTTIQWSKSPLPDDNFYSMKGYGYVKIQ